ncbi:MAG: hypothetical protein CVU46_06245 [Chloroflexi bacterium HGW-Chloroflexi-8]|nr:MAG: hypothetical protein CVU46_06245 [Chloroflexi bacterium HGW-Chloroflexi-8]
MFFRKSRIFYFGIIAVYLISCSPKPIIINNPIQYTIESSSTVNVKVIWTDTHTPSPQPTMTSTSTRTPSITPTLTSTSTPSPTPTYSILRGEVIAEHVSCFYGPHKSYLYKYGLLGGSNLEIIGRNVDTNYIEIRATGGTNPCWMNSEWMNIKGDINVIEPIDPKDIVLPESPYYGPLTGVQAVRNGKIVTISWNLLAISPGKDSLQYPYLVETWLCQNGKIVFFPIGSWTNSIDVEDQTGCIEPSYARVYGVEKHGYTPPVEIPWPIISK